jgi:hypothetical protein
MGSLQCSAEVLAALQGLSGLQTLFLPVDTGKELGVVCQLTGLRELHLVAAASVDKLLLQLTQLKQITNLDFRAGGYASVNFTSQVRLARWWEVQ